MYGTCSLPDGSIVCSKEDLRKEGKNSVFFKGDVFLPKKELEEILNALSRGKVNLFQLTNLRGQFAIVVFSKEENTIWLARDHFGVMPFYYAVENKCVFFGTTIMHVLKAKTKVSSMNQSVLHEYFMFRYVSGRNTLFNDIYEAQPGAAVRINSHSKEKQNYFEYNYSTDLTGKDPTACVRFQEAFWESLKRQTDDKAQRKIGVLSSGGIDSSILVSCASKILEPHFKTYYIANEGYEHNRVTEVEYLSKLYETDHTNVFVSGKKFADRLIETIRINEEPLNHPSSVLVEYLYSLLSDQIDVVLSGEGADCFYCGYYIFDLIKYLYIKNTCRPITKILGSLLVTSLFPKQYRDKVEKIRSALVLPPDEYAIFHDLLTFNTRKTVSQLVSMDFPDTFAGTYTSLFQRYSPKDILNIILNVYQTYYIIEAFNTLSKLGEAHNLEQRHPFVDVHMINMFNELPWREKTRFFKRKHQIVELGKKYLPKEFFRKNKEGFGVPLRFWFYEEKGLGRFMSLLSDQKTRERGIFRRRYLDYLLHCYAKKNVPQGYFESVFWPIINLELWYRIFIDENLIGIE